MAAEKRAVITNDVLDFQLTHSQLQASGGEHFGPAEDALRNRVRHLP
jgi:hypothetical protein